MNRCFPPAVRRGSQILAIGCVLALTPVATAAGSAGPTGHVAQARRSVHHIDVDGDGTPDRVAITLGRHFQVDDRFGRGHYTVRVRLSSTGQVVSRRIWSNGYTDRFHHGRWNPLFGATQLDRRPGKELVLGFDSGASSSQFYVLRYIHGALHLLGTPPAGRSWSGNSDVEESSGYRCPAHGVETREYGVIGNGKTRRLVIDHAWFVRRDGRWHRTKHARRVRHGANPRLPRSDFGTFRCAGLPKDEI